MWTETTRGQYERRGLRYAGDLTDVEWGLVEPLRPPARRLGRPRRWRDREIVEAILSLLQTGCQWRMLPKEFPPRRAVHRYFIVWCRDGIWRCLHFALFITARERGGREPQPTAGVIDSQSVKTTESGGPRGFDAGKKVVGRKRHLGVDTEGHLAGAIVHPGDVQDRDGALLVRREVGSLFPWLRHVFADGAYAGAKLRGRRARLGVWTVEIVKRSDTAKGFVVLLRRWVVERTFAWFGRNRRLAKDFERFTETATELLSIAAIKLLVRHLARA